MKRYLMFLWVTILSIVSFNMYAWWDIGHEITAAVAEQYMTPASNEKADALLAYAVKYPCTKNGVSIGNDIISSSLWLDNIKSGVWDNTNDKNNCSNSHFIDIKYDVSSIPDTFDSGFTKVQAGKSSMNYNSLSALDSAIKTLASANSSILEQAVALRFIIHLVADIHCPMHSSDPYVNEESTSGGNAISFNPAISLPIYNSSKINIANNMHKLWDGLCGAYAALPYGAGIDYAYIRSCGSEIISRYGNKTDEYPANSGKWATCAFLIAEWASSSNEVTYSDMEGKIKNYEGDYKVKGQDYSKEQLYFGGYRLAKLLNAILDSANADPAYIAYINSIQNDSNIKSLQGYLCFNFR